MRARGAGHEPPLGVPSPAPGPPCSAPAGSIAQPLPPAHGHTHPRAPWPLLPQPIRGRYSNHCSLAASGRGGGGAWRPAIPTASFIEGELGGQRGAASHRKPEVLGVLGGAGSTEHGWLPACMHDKDPEDRSITLALSPKEWGEPVRQWGATDSNQGWPSLGRGGQQCLGCFVQHP